MNSTESNAHNFFILLNPVNPVKKNSFLGVFFV